MEIKPQNFEVSEELLRQRLNLPLHATVFPFGYEGLDDDSLIRMLKLRYDSASLYFRTRPDYMILDDNYLYLVEAKKRTKNVEAIQLFFNKYLERMGIKVVYSFPELSVRATQIPMEKIVIPENYSQKFDENLKHLFKKQGITEFCYVGKVPEGKGSGDAFVPIDVEYLKLLTKDLLI